MTAPAVPPLKKTVSFGLSTETDDEEEEEESGSLSARRIRFDGFKCLSCVYCIGSLAFAGCMVILLKAGHRSTPPFLAASDVITFSAGVGTRDDAEAYVRTQTTSSQELDGDTPLHAAAGIGDVKALDAWLERGYDVNAKNKHGASPLMVAAYGGHREAIRSLLDHGADVHIISNGWSPVGAALLTEHAEAARLLSEHGCECLPQTEFYCKRWMSTEASYALN
jgi:hypothetical protein